MDEINTEMVTYLQKHSRANAGELATLTGISVPSVRMRLLQLIANGIVGEEKTRNHRRWFFLKEKEGGLFGKHDHESRT